MAHLTQDILSRDSEEAYALASEHELCRLFNLSRVTVRLALGDLENRGTDLSPARQGDPLPMAGEPSLPQHRGVRADLVAGKPGGGGTGAGDAKRPDGDWRGGDVDRGEAFGLAAGAGEPAQRGGDPAVGGGRGDLSILRQRNLPFLLVGDSELAGPRIVLGQEEAARTLTEKLLGLGHRSFGLLTGMDAGLDGPKRRGVNGALRAAGLDPAAVPEFAADQGGSAFEAARALLESSPRPTAVIAFDDSLAGILSYKARRQMGLRVPEDLSIVSFHDWPFLAEMNPALCTVRFDFFAAGRQAAAALNRAAQTGGVARGYSVWADLCGGGDGGGCAGLGDGDGDFDGINGMGWVR